MIAVEDGNPARVLQAACDALRDGQPVALAIVLETEGSTYTRAGSLALFGRNGHVGWLSGGCLEPEIERRAMRAVKNAQLEWLEIDTRDDDALFGGNAVGCRGRQRVVLVPLPSLPGVEVLWGTWLGSRADLELLLTADGQVQLRCGSLEHAWELGSLPLPWCAGANTWQLRWQRAPQAMILGAGPEAAPLLPLLTGLGWRVTLQEPRESWRERSHARAVATGEPLDHLLQRHAAPDAVLVMHHNFERDLQALEHLAGTSVPFIGLLGPERRREDLFKLLSVEVRASLLPRLRSPVGLPLGGRGPEAIALSIAAQLQAWRHGMPGGDT